jgi:hypothetical protein
VTDKNAPSPPPIAERREVLRERKFLGGVIVHSEGRFSTKCTIRNITRSGARLSLTDSVAIPTDFFLVDTKTATVHRAHVAWIKSANAGVFFLENFTAKSLPPDLVYLRRFLKLSGPSITWE